MAISELEQVPGGKLHNPRVLAAIGCLMSLRRTLGVNQGTMTEPTPNTSVEPLTVLATLEVVGYDGSREIVSVKDPGSDRVKYLAPVSGTSLSYIDVRTPSGPIYRIQVDDGVLSAIFDTPEGLRRCQKAIEG